MHPLPGHLRQPPPSPRPLELQQLGRNIAPAPSRQVDGASAVQWNTTVGAASVTAHAAAGAVGIAGGSGHGRRPQRRLALEADPEPHLERGENLEELELQEGLAKPCTSLA